MIFMTKFDFLAPKPQLYVDGKSSFRTTFGALLSIAIISFTITGAIYFGKELFYREEPNVVISALEVDSSSVMLNETDYYIYFNIQDQNYIMYNDPRVFRFTAFNDIMDINEDDSTQTLKRVELEIDLCSKYFNAQNDDTAGKNVVIDMSNSYCLKSNQAKIEGFWGASHNSYIRVILERCINSTLNNNLCLSESDIDLKINGGIIGMFSQNYILNTKSFESPVVPHLDDIYYSLNADLTFDLTIGLKPLLINSDLGFIFKAEEELTKFYSDSPLQLLFGKRDSLLAQVIIEGKPLGMRITRTYAKFQDILTKVGGLIKALTVIGGFIISYSSHVQFTYKYIYDSMINFPVAHSFLVEPDKTNRSCAAIFNNNFVTKEKCNIDPLTHEKSITPKFIHASQSQIRTITSLTPYKSSYKASQAFHDFLYHHSCCSSHNQKKKLFYSVDLILNKYLSIESMLETALVFEAQLGKLESNARHEYFLNIFQKLILLSVSNK